MKRSPAFLFVTAALLCVPVSAEAPSAARIIELARKKLAAVRDYSVDIRLDVQSDQLTVKGMRMTLYYRRPGRMRLVARDGLAAMPRGIVMGDFMDELTRNCRPTLVGVERKNGVACYAIRLEPESRAGGPPVNIWLSKSGYLLRETSIEEPFSLKTQWFYGRVDDKYDLPCRIIATFSSPDIHTVPRPGFGPGQGAGGLRTVRATLTFSNYKVNRGIRDSVFVEND